MSYSDTVFLRGLRFELCVGLDAWGRKGKPQPVSISLHIKPQESLQAAAAGDDVSKTLDYGKLYKTLTASLATTEVGSTAELIDIINHAISPSMKSLRIDVFLPKAALRAHGGLVFNATYRPGVTEIVQTVKSISCACIIGVNAHERLHKQIVDVDLRFERSEEVARPSGAPTTVPLSNFQDVVEAVAQRVESSSFQTVEALATAIAQTITMDHGIEAVTVGVEKPNAIASIEAAGVQLYRRRSFFANKDFWQVKQEDSNS